MVAPLVFPGGDIGKLAVYNSVNDLVVSEVIPAFNLVNFPRAEKTTLLEKP